MILPLLFGLWFAMGLLLWVHGLREFLDPWAWSGVAWGPLWLAGRVVGMIGRGMR